MKLGKETRVQLAQSIVVGSVETTVISMHAGLCFIHHSFVLDFTPVSEVALEEADEWSVSAVVGYASASSASTYIDEVPTIHRHWYSRDHLKTVPNENLIDYFNSVLNPGDQNKYLLATVSH